MKSAPHPCNEMRQRALEAFCEQNPEEIDDILDVTADSATLGKTAGKDAAQQKPTFVSLMGLDASRNYAQQLLTRAHASLGEVEATGLHNTAALRALADMLVNRQH